MNFNDLFIIKDRTGTGPRVLLINEAVTIYDGFEGNVVLFDQEKDMIHSIRHSTSPYVQQHKELKYEVESFKPEVIVKVTSIMSEEDVSAMLDKLITDTVITMDDKQAILNTLHVRQSSK